MEHREAPGSRRVLVLTPSGRDTKLTRDLLEREGIAGHVCATIEDLAGAIRAGAGAALVAEELLAPDALPVLVSVLAEQPPWSDFPFVVFGAAGAGDPPLEPRRALAALGNATFLERPVRVRTMLSAVRAALRARERQYAALREIEARDEFLAMLGHELRNPLAAIRLAVQYLARMQDPERRSVQVEVIDRQSRNLSRLVDDLLDVARVTHGKVRLKSEDVDLAAIVREQVQLHEPTARDQGLTLYLSIRADGAIVVGDRVRLEQVLGNLLTNAIKYTPPGGEVRAVLELDGGRAVLRVADTGVGIAPDLLPRVFDMFAQADRSLDRSQGGMGLGLTLVRRLVEMHRGEVQATSGGPGTGSEFVVALPLAAPRDETAASEAAGDTSGREVVVVEDNEDIREIQQMLLESAGHRVSTAADGPSGTARILETRPQVAFVDIGLPGYDGFEVARRVRAELGRSVVLVAVSGYGKPEDQARALEAGFDRHVTKPAGLEDLEAAMRALPG